MNLKKKLYIFILILCSITIIGLFYFNFWKKKTFEGKKKYAVCIYGQLRGVNNCIEPFYKNLVEPLNADVFILAQKTNTDIDNNIDLFNKHVVEKIIYDPPIDITKEYSNYNKLNLNYSDGLVKENDYNKNSNLQVFYNLYKIYQTFGDRLENDYDYIILTRSDYYYLFPFPDILQLIENHDIIWGYDGHEYGGLNLSLSCIHSKHIKKFLSACYEYIENKDNIEKLNTVFDTKGINLNAEYFCKMVFENYEFGKIQMNSFIACDSIDEITTTMNIFYDEHYKVFYKYREQLDKSYSSLEQYNNGYKWVYINEIENNTKKIILNK